LPAVALALAAGLLWTFATPGSEAGAGPEMLRRGLGCLVTGTVLSGGLALAAALIGRGSLRRHAPTGALVGVGAGLVALVPLQLHCTADAPIHLLLWHVLVPVAGGVVAGALWRLRGQ
jgi:hypothetical protein